MARKRVTEMFPFLIPIRVFQKNLFYKIGMFFDKNTYAKRYGENLPYEVSRAKTLMINEKSGYDIKYQKNKVDNLKLASKTIHQLLIYPGETFSFYKMFQKSSKYGKYKDGLVLVNGKIVPQKGGGICQFSNLLYYLFLMTPLTIVERHGHKVKSLPNPDKDALEGVDATISSGWLDLKVRNDTEAIYQIEITFDSEYMYGRILSNKDSSVYYTICNQNFKYLKKGDSFFESVEVVRKVHDKESEEVIKEEKLYDEVVQITYKLEEDVEWEEI